MLSQDSFSAFYDSLPDAVLICDKKGVIKFCNSHVINKFGYKKDELIGNTVEILLSEEFHREHVNLRKNFQNMSCSRSMAGSKKLKAITKNSVAIPVTISLSPLSVDGLNMTAVSIRDITELVAAENKERQSEEKAVKFERMGNLGLAVRNISHDMNNLIFAIRGNVELIQMGSETTTKSLKYLNDISIVASQLQDLTKQILVYSEGGKLDRDDINISQLTEEMMPLLRASINSVATISCSIHKKTEVLVSCYSNQLRQVILNLVSNAADAISNSNGEIQIFTGITNNLACSHLNSLSQSDIKPGNYGYVKVCDNGSGMRKKVAENLFAEHFSTSNIAGKGIGLSSVKEIIDEHNGYILVDSELGVGTTITVLLPFVGDLNEYDEYELSLELELSKAKGISHWYQILSEHYSRAVQQ